MPDAYLIWSNEHRAWWRPFRMGYTTQLLLAGRYPREIAMQICIDALPGNARLLGAMPEIPVLEADACAMAAAFRQRYPTVPPEPWE